MSSQALNPAAAFEGSPTVRPPRTAPDGDLWRWLQQGAQYQSLVRLERCSRWRWAELMDQGTQNIQRAYTTSAAAEPWQWRELVEDPTDPYGIPLYVVNEGLGPRRNETARLARPDYQPIGMPKGEDPDSQSRLQAKKMAEVIISELDRMNWDAEADLVFHRLPVHGIVFLKSEWEQSWDDTTPVPVQGALACARHTSMGGHCDFTAVSTNVSARDLAPRYPSLANALPGIAADSYLPESDEGPVCPQCLESGNLVPLKPYSPTMEEAAQGQDAFGRPLGDRKPKGQWRLSCRSPYDIFLENSGVNIGWQRFRRWTEIHVESVDDWLPLHYPETAAQVRRENPAALMEYHPIVGSPSLYGHGLDSGVFMNHVRIFERHEAPRMVWDDQRKGFVMDRGLSLVMANPGVRLFAGDYQMQSLTRPGQFVDRVRLEAIPWELRDGGIVIDGLSQWQVMGDPQQIINDIWMQRAAIRQRCAVPVYIERKAWNLESVQNRTGLPGAWISIETDAEAPNEIPRLINNETMAAGANQELEQASVKPAQLGGETSVEQGNAPPNVSAATAMGILKEESGTKRAPTIRRVKAALRRSWRHGAELVSAFWIEKRDYKIIVASGQQQWGQAWGTDFDPDTIEIDIKPEPAFETRDQEREATRDIVQLGIDLSTPLGRKIAKELDAPTDLFLDENLQEQEADREWMEFIRKKRAPVSDPLTDDPMLHFQFHGQRALSEEFRALSEGGGWDGALRILNPTWDIDLQTAVMPPPIPIMGPDGVTPMMQPPQLPPGLPPPPPGMPPEMLPPALQPQPMTTPNPMLAMDLQDRIVKIWEDRLAVAGYQPVDPEKLSLTMGWLSHMAAHRLSAEAKMAQAQAAPTLSAPGAPQTAAGTMPTPGAPALPEQLMAGAPGA